MTPSIPLGYFKAGPNLWTSRMFPLLEPYTELHRAFFTSMIKDVTIEVPRLLGKPRKIRLHDCVPSVRDGLMVLLQDFIIIWETDDGSFYKLIIPAGFITDVASIPLVVQLIFRMHSDGSVRPAALPHDLLYQLKELLCKVRALFKGNPYRFNAGDEWEHDTRPWTKSAMDKFFAKIMKAYGTPLNTLIYLGVRWGGGLAYLQNDDSRYYTAALYDVPEALRNSWSN